MKFLEGKSPSEKKKVIAAIVLGGLAVIALGYTLSQFFAGPAKTPSGSSSPTPKPSATVTAGVRPSQDPLYVADLNRMLTTPISFDPNTYSSDAGRNIFAFYEPPPPTPWQPTPIPVVSVKPPTPEPPPPFDLTFVNPSSIYAGSKGFRLEVMGDRFTTDARIIYNGNELPTNFISAQKLTADIPAMLIAADGTRQIIVRTPDGTKYSRPLMMQVQAPPIPNFEYVGLVEKKHRNNDLAVLREKGKTDVLLSFRLNDPVGDRFKVVSISAREVVLEDRSLGFKHKLPFFEGKSSGTSAGGGPIDAVRPGGGFGRGTPGGGIPTYIPYNPSGPANPTIPSGDIPGIPSNIPRYIPPTAANTVRNPTTKKDYEDDNEGPHR